MTNTGFGYRLLFVVALSGFTALAQTPDTAKSASTTKAIHGAGCTRAGVEGACMVLTDTKTKKSLNLFFPNGKKPDLDTGISFTGREHAGPSTCMQGAPVDVTKWRTIRIHCPKPESTAASQ